MFDAGTLLTNYLIFFILPLWMVAGLSDYLLHRRTRIEENAGTKESMLHLLQLSEVGIPVLLALLVDINAFVILIMLIGLVLHEITALWDVSYASKRRYVSPLEQHVHSFLEVLPLMAVSFVTVMYWDQFMALFGVGAETVSFALRPKANPLPTLHLVALLVSVACFVVLPYAEELWRCIRAVPSRRLRQNTKQTLRSSQAA
jgi:hypothetical protein